MSVSDDRNGVIDALATHGKSGEREPFALHVRSCAPELFSGLFIFISEEDAVLKGSYLWALAAPYGPDMLLVWPTSGKKDSFERLVNDSALPGAKVQPEDGRSRILGSVRRTLILTKLTEAQCKYITQNAGSLFVIFPLIYERVGRIDWIEGKRAFPDENPDPR